MHDRQYCPSPERNNEMHQLIANKQCFSKRNLIGQLVVRYRMTGSFSIFYQMNLSTLGNELIQYFINTNYIHSYN